MIGVVSADIGKSSSFLPDDHKCKTSCYTSLGAPEPPWKASSRRTQDHASHHERSKMKIPIEDRSDVTVENNYRLVKRCTLAVSDPGISMKP